MFELLNEEDIRNLLYIVRISRKIKRTDHTCLDKCLHFGAYLAGGLDKGDTIRIVTYLLKQIKNKEGDSLVEGLPYIYYVYSLANLFRRAYLATLATPVKQESNPNLNIKGYTHDDYYIKEFVNYNYIPYKTFSRLHHPAHLEAIVESAFRNHPHLLFTGEPGTGKTSICEFLASRGGAPYEKIRNVKQLQQLTTTSPSGLNIVVDDVDELIKNNEGLKLMLDLLDNDRLSIYMSTNHPKKLCKAFLRQGRVHKIIEVGNLGRDDAIILIYKTIKFHTSFMYVDKDKTPLTDNTINVILAKNITPDGLYSPVGLAKTCELLLSQIIKLPLQNFLISEKESLKQGLYADGEVELASNREGIGLTGEGKATIEDVSTQPPILTAADHFKSAVKTAAATVGKGVFRQFIGGSKLKARERHEFVSEGSLSYDAED